MIMLGGSGEKILKLGVLRSLLRLCFGLESPTCSYIQPAKPLEQAARNVQCYGDIYVSVLKG